MFDLILFNNKSKLTKNCRQSASKLNTSFKSAPQVFVSRVPSGRTFSFCVLYDAEIDTRALSKYFPKCIFCLFFQCVGTLTQGSRGLCVLCPLHCLFFLCAIVFFSFSSWVKTGNLVKQKYFNYVSYASTSWMNGKCFRFIALFLVGNN